MKLVLYLCNEFELNPYSELVIIIDYLLIILLKKTVIMLFNKWSYVSFMGFSVFSLSMFLSIIGALFCRHRLKLAD